MAGFLLLLLLLIIALGAGVVMLVLARGGLRDYPACGACGCDVSEAIGASAHCPGCGRPFAERGIIAPGGIRRPALLGAGVGLLVVSLAGLAGVMILTPRTVSELGATRAETVKEHLRALKARGEAEAAETALEEIRREGEAADETEPAEADDTSAAPQAPAPAATDDEEKPPDAVSPDAEGGGTS